MLACQPGLAPLQVAFVQHLLSRRSHVEHARQDPQQPYIVDKTPASKRTQSDTGLYPSQKQLAVVVKMQCAVYTHGDSADLQSDLRTLTAVATLRVS